MPSLTKYPPLSEPTIRNHKGFSTITPDKPSNFGQSLNVLDWVNWIKGEFSQCYKNSAFGILTNTPNDNLPSTTRVLLYVLSPSIKNISDNIYRYWPQHFANGGSQVKGIEFYQHPSPVLVEPTVRLIIAISDTYHLTIITTDVTNAFQNTLKSSSEL